MSRLLCDWTQQGWIAQWLEHLVYVQKAWVQYPVWSLFCILTDIDLLSDELGIPWETSKTIPFRSIVPYLDFVWDLNACSVAIPVEKKLKYLDAIKEWEKKPTHTLAEVQRLYSKLLHASLVVTAGRAYLTNLEAMLSVFNNSPFVPHTQPCDASNNLKWWAEHLQCPTLSRNVPGPVPLTDLNALSDAHSGFSIGMAGGPMDEILAGLRLLDLSSRAFSSYHLVAAALTSKFMGTTKKSSKDSGKDTVGTSKWTSSSSISMPSSTLGNALSTPGMSPARTTQLTICLEESICLLHISCPTYPSPQSYAPSSQTSTLSSPLQALISTSHNPPCPSPVECFQTTSMPQSMLSLTIEGRSSSHDPPSVSEERCTWNNLLPASSSLEKCTWPALYHKNLVPLPSPLRPHCQAISKIVLMVPTSFS